MGTDSNYPLHLRPLYLPGDSPVAYDPVTGAYVWKESDPSKVAIAQPHVVPEQVKPDEVDDVDNPTHYTRWKIEPVTFVMRNGMEFWRGNIIKYASRAGFKAYGDQGPIQSEINDLRKVIRYAEMRINQLNGETEL
jgi:hypothetical protein